MKRSPAACAALLLLLGISAARAESAAPVSQAVDSTTALMNFLAVGQAHDILASELVGSRLYAAERSSVTRTSWMNLGVVDDVLLTRDGKVRAVLVDIGSFLGIGGKIVAVPLESIRHVPNSTDPDRDTLLITATRETLNDAPAYQRFPAGAKDLPMTGARRSPTRLGGGAKPLQPAAAGTSMLASDGYRRATIDDLTAERLINAAVYGPGDSRVGTIKSLIMSEGGAITEAVIDVGGILGVGAHPVAVPFGDLKVMRQDGGEDVRVLIDTPKERLEALPRHAG